MRLRHVNLERLVHYYHALGEQAAAGEFFSSAQIAELLHMDDTQIRKDLAAIGVRGYPRRGFRTAEVTEAIRETLAHNGLKLDDIAYVVPHQANQRIIAAAAGRSGIPHEKFYLNLHEYANTSAASIPIALNEMHERGLLKRGDYLMFIGFGAGLTYGANLVRY